MNDAPIEFTQSPRDKDKAVIYRLDIERHRRNRNAIEQRQAQAKRPEPKDAA